ncbi:MAG: DUF4831 family protein [Bacteroidota bacterium]
MKKASYILLLPFILFSCARINVVHVTPANQPSKKQGFYYNLPATALKISMQVTRTEYTAGPYRQFAESLLGLKDVILFDSVNYEMGKVSIASESMPDAGQYYFVEIPSRRKCHHRSDIAMDLSSQGAVMSVNPPRMHKPVVKKTMVYRNGNSMGVDLKDAGITQNMVERFDTIYENVYIDSLWAQKRTVRRFYTRKTSEERAKEVAEAITGLRKMRTNLIGGEGDTPYDEKTIRFMLDKLDSELNEYMALFAGQVQQKTETYTFSFYPDSAVNMKNVPVWTFSSTEGISVNGEGVQISLRLQSMASVPVIDYVRKKNKISPKKRGLRYRMPAYTTVSVYLGNTQLCENALMIPQLGDVAALPLKKMKSRLTFNPDGSLKRVEVK